MGTRWWFVLLALLVYKVDGGVFKTSSPAIIEDVRTPGSKVVGGWPAEDYQIPFQISLRMSNALGTVSACGGSVMNHEWILTAAHCVANRVSFVIRLGLINVTRPEYIVDTTSYYIHPQYIEPLGGVQTHDIALIYLETSVPYTRGIQPSRLQPSFQITKQYVGEVLTVSGYGLTDDAENGGATSEILLWTHLRGITNEECRWWYGGSTIIQDVTICAEYYNHTSQSACSGDSGGPLTFIDEDGITTQVGIVSFGSSAGCNSAFPSAYVRPGHYHDWYRTITGYDFDWTADDYQEQGGGDNDNGEVATAAPPSDGDNNDAIEVATLPPSDDNDHDDADAIGIVTLPPNDDNDHDDADGIGIVTLPPSDDNDHDNADAIGIVTLPPSDDNDDDDVTLPPSDDNDHDEAEEIEVVTLPSNEDDGVAIVTLPQKDYSDHGDHVKVVALPPSGVA